MNDMTLDDRNNEPFEFGQLTDAEASADRAQWRRECALQDELDAVQERLVNATNAALAFLKRDMPHTARRLLLWALEADFRPKHSLWERMSVACELIIRGNSELAVKTLVGNNKADWKGMGWGV